MKRARRSAQNELRLEKRKQKGDKIGKKRETLREAKTKQCTSVKNKQQTHENKKQVKQIKGNKTNKCLLKWQKMKKRNI